jgi:GNAT superfamily N-acetyltransferase
VSEVSRLGADDFKKAMDEAEGGLTGLAVRVGKEFKTPEQIEILRALEDLAKDEMRTALKEGRMDDAMILASKPQFFREARESATSTGSIAAAEARGDFPPTPISKLAFLPAEDLPNTPIFHATSNDADGRSILRGGFVRPGRTVESRASLAPMAGKTYAASNPEQVGAYAIGAASGQGMSTIRGNHGWIFRLDPEKKQRVHLDEDILGVLASDVLQSPTYALIEESKSLLPETRARLASFVKRNTTERQQRLLDRGSMAAMAQVGKSLTRKLGRQDPSLEKAIAHETGSSIAIDGDVRVVQAWRITPDNARKLAEDGSNIAELAEPVDIVAERARLLLEAGDEGTPGAKFLPRTDAGKELAKRFEFREKVLPRGERLLELTDLDTSDVAATVSYTLGEGREPAIESVLVDPAYRGQDIAQGLLREVFARAQDAGEVEVGSLPGIIDPAMIAVREKVAPGRNAFEDFRTEEPFADAREAQDFFRDPDNKFPLVTAVTDIQGIKFLPREKGTATEKLPLPVKAFIEPDGKFTKVTDATHDDFLIGNADKYNKKFGTKIPKTQGKEDVRIGALNKGFIRIAYEPNNGRLTYEANAKTFSRKQADKIFEHVADNLDSIDIITVALLDEKGNVVKTASRKFFLMDDDAAKLDAIPFVTDEGRPDSPRTVGAFAPRRLLNDEAFPAEVEKIARGDKDGETFNADGTIFNPGDEALDVVTVASVDLPVSQLTPAAVVAALKPFRELMGNENVKPGLFRIARQSPGGEEQVSVDVNAVAPQKFRKNTLAFARKNNQESFFDLVKFETVDSGGDGNTVLTDPVQIAEAVDRLAAGKPYTFPKPTLPDPEAFPDTIEVPAQPDLGLAIEAAEPAILGRLQRAALTQAQLKEHFPEAIVPKRGAKIDNDITKSPLYRQHKTEPARVNAFADKLEALFRQHESDPEAQAGLRWYDDFTPRLKERYGEDAQVFAELLAATSPNTPPRTNFHFADAAFKRWKAGEFDAIISKYQEGLNKLADGSLLEDFEKSGAPQPKKISDSILMRWWIDKHELSPTQRPRQTPEGPVSKKFGMHSIAVLKVITRQWLNDNLGLKTNNFVRNLLGTSEEATIDLWAARTMREAGYKGFKDRWRILPENGRGVRDPDFLFSQKVFAEVARRTGLLPRQIQGALWFIEKKRWADRGWSELDLGDYRAELDRIARRDAEISIPDPQGEFFNE